MRRVSRWVQGNMTYVHDIPSAYLQDMLGFVDRQLWHVAECRWMSYLLSNVHECVIAAVKLRVLSGSRVTHQGEGGDACRDWWRGKTLVSQAKRVRLMASLDEVSVVSNHRILSAWRTVPDKRFCNPQRQFCLHKACARFCASLHVLYIHAFYGEEAHEVYNSRNLDTLVTCCTHVCSTRAAGLRREYLAISLGLSLSLSFSQPV